MGYDDLCSDSEQSLNVSYWDGLDAIRNWKRHADHLSAQALGKEKWYRWYEIRISKVERAYSSDS